MAAGRCLEAPKGMRFAYMIGHASHMKRKLLRVTIGRLLPPLCSGCIIIVVLTHVAEGFHILPAMGWGLPNSRAITSIS